ncbi:translation initiation factor IF-2 isoform X1 [Phalacrocorax carbo]|uniref:translation initiation factor IF-2 isoform X1 n=1 Tax=Phalacrocorax carbo TaxID=9209 RepID=UPI003119579F
MERHTPHTPPPRPRRPARRHNAPPPSRPRRPTASRARHPFASRWSGAGSGCPAPGAGATPSRRGTAARPGHLTGRRRRHGGRAGCGDRPRGHVQVHPDHIFEKVNPEMQKLGYECKCLGGGKIDHNSKDKKIRVFGLSTGYGKADHSVTAEILKKVYTDYEITWSDDKK